jgi:hypothetical protein
VQVGLQLLDLASWTVGEHADRAHTDHDLVGWVDDVGNFDPTFGEAAVNALTCRSHSGIRVELMDRGLAHESQIDAVHHIQSGSNTSFP